MRLEFEAEFTRSQRAKAWVARKVVGSVPGPIATMSYDPGFFGNEFSQSLEDAMRRMKLWSLGEVELFAAFVSQLNSCAY